MRNDLWRVINDIYPLGKGEIIQETTPGYWKIPGIEENYNLKNDDFHFERCSHLKIGDIVPKEKIEEYVRSENHLFLTLKHKNPYRWLLAQDYIRAPLCKITAVEEVSGECYIKTGGNSYYYIKEQEFIDFCFPIKKESEDIQEVLAPKFKRGDKVICIRNIKGETDLHSLPEIGKKYTISHMGIYDYSRGNGNETCIVPEGESYGGYWPASAFIKVEEEGEKSPLSVENDSQCPKYNIGDAVVIVSGGHYYCDNTVSEKSREKFPTSNLHNKGSCYNIVDISVHKTLKGEYWYKLDGMANLVSENGLLSADAVPPESSSELSLDIFEDIENLHLPKYSEYSLSENAENKYMGSKDSRKEEKLTSLGGVKLITPEKQPELRNFSF